MFSPPNLGAWRLLVTPARPVCASEVASFLFQHPAHHARYWKQLVLQNRKGLTFVRFMSHLRWLPGYLLQDREVRSDKSRSWPGPGNKDHCAPWLLQTCKIYVSFEVATWLPSLGTRPSKNRKGGSGTSARVEVYTAPGMKAHFRLAFD